MVLKTILVADEDRAIRTVLGQALGRAGYQVRATHSPERLWSWVDEGEGDVALVDLALVEVTPDLLVRIRGVRPDLRIVLTGAQATAGVAARAAALGAFEYLPKPFDLGVLLAVMSRALSLPVERLGVVAPVKEERAEAVGPVRMIGETGVIRELRRTVARLAGSDLAVLMTGESGTGKEVVARALHEEGARKAGPFVALTIATVPPEQVDRVLFGTAEQGGLIAEASGGTLFLDEIADLPPTTQGRLLSVAQDGEIHHGRRKAAQAVDLRLITATSRDIPALIREGVFREDLYHRLNVVRLHLPALRERAEDIPLLVAHVLEEVVPGEARPPVVTPEAMAVLMGAPWPGNVRELENVVRGVRMLHSGGEIGAGAVETALRASVEAPEAEVLPERLTEAIERHLRPYLESGLPVSGLYDQIMAEVERPLIGLVLRATAGNQIRAAAMLGLNRNTLRKKMRELDITAREGSVPRRMLRRRAGDE